MVHPKIKIGNHCPKINIKNTASIFFANHWLSKNKHKTLYRFFWKMNQNQLNHWLAIFWWNIYNINEFSIHFNTLVVRNYFFQKYISRKVSLRKTWDQKGWSSISIFNQWTKSQNNLKTFCNSKIFKTQLSQKP